MGKGFAPGISSAGGDIPEREGEEKPHQAGLYTGFAGSITCNVIA
jgi:hypothetical protein